MNRAEWQSNQSFMREEHLFLPDYLLACAIGMTSCSAPTRNSQARRSRNFSSSGRIVVM